jgi:hypothetical protein
MAVEEDQSAWLPEPPPPRPARRDAAIDAALRKFDGIEDTAPAPAERQRPSWVSVRRPQLAFLASAALLLVVGIPAALVGLRSQQPPAERAQNTAVARDLRRSPAPAPPAPPAAQPPGPSNPNLGAAPPLRKYRGEEPAPQADRAAAAESPAAAKAEAPPEPSRLAAAPLPPPPPPAPPPMAERDSEGIATQDIAVTGSRIAQPALEAPSAAKASSPDQARAAFLSRLQSAVRAGNRSAVIALAGLPLRVNGPGGTRLYRDAVSIQRDFDRIFTPKVRRAILAQRADQLFTRDQGTMIGDGEVWFDQTCPNSACTAVGPVRIIAVNP